ncbi:hypothetical protein PsYK624_098630 [Phanerochaete sordida]|uniref:Uncharacterized protein n=1 Tax=Phanerochaete sordida TaxID=48140 RepID=A0A9P3LH35_9APHY|nr:hypothetical protein PsYK624_098630 [Phanerochaete sordida]
MKSLPGYFPTLWATVTDLAQAQIAFAIAVSPDAPPHILRARFGALPYVHLLVHRFSHRYAAHYACRACCGELQTSSPPAAHRAPSSAPASSRTDGRFSASTSPQLADRQTSDDRGRPPSAKSNVACPRCTSKRPVPPVPCPRFSARAFVPIGPRELPLRRSVAMSPLRCWCPVPPDLSPRAPRPALSPPDAFPAVECRCRSLLSRRCFSAERPATVLPSVSLRTIPIPPRNLPSHRKCSDCGARMARSKLTIFCAFYGDSALLAPAAYS